MGKIFGVGLCKGRKIVMPNHVRHIMKVTGKADEFFEAVKSSDEYLFDFDNIVPMPEYVRLPKGVDGITGSIESAAELVMMHNNWPVFDFRGRRQNIDSIIHYDQQVKWVDKDFLLFQRCCNAIMDCGYSNWHPWSVVHWGTKWGAYNINKEDDTIRFETAWNTPMKIWEKIATMFPHTSFDIHYASEDYGFHCGIIKIHDGNLHHEEVNTDEFAYETWEFDADEILEMTNEE